MMTLMLQEFGLEPTIRISEGRWAGLRYVSTAFHAWLAENFPEMMSKARSKRAPAKILAASVANINGFLTTAFLGDGGVETDAVCYRTASRGLAEDYQDLLLKLGIASRIALDRSNESYKVYIRGDSLGAFLERVVDPLDHRRGKIEKLVERSGRNNRSHDVLPTGVAKIFVQLLHDAGMRYNGYFSQHLESGNGITKPTTARLLNQIEARCLEVLSMLQGKVSVKGLREAAGWSQQRLASECGVKRSTINYAERGGYGPQQVSELTGKVRGAIGERLASVVETTRFIRDLMGLRFLRVTGVEVVPNRGKVETEWVYDVTVEPRHNFVSAGVVLHNTVTIAKGGIYATLNARTAILAATNPILGKYDPYQNLIDNITLPIPLLDEVRPDLRAQGHADPAAGREAGHAHPRRPQEEGVRRATSDPVRPAEEVHRLRQELLAGPHHGGGEQDEGVLPPAQEERDRGADRRDPEDARVPDPPLSAKARLMLRDEVPEDDALTAISLMNKMVEDVLTDTETKTKGDFGILLGQPAGERGKLATVMDTLRTLEGPERKPIEAKVFRQELMRTNKFANEDEVDNLIKKITKEGIIFESKPGFFRRVQG